MHTQIKEVNLLEFRGNYNATSNNMKLVHWPLMGGLLHLIQYEEGLGGGRMQPAQSPPRCNKCNSPPINGQCTNHRIAVRCSTVLTRPFPSAGTAVSLFRAKTIQQRPLLPREVETRLPTPQLIRQPDFDLPRQQWPVSAEPFSHGTGTLRCLQKEMATYRHWSVSLWRDADDVPHCRILSPDKTEWRLISATLCGWRRCFVADQLWFMTRIREEEEEEEEEEERAH